MMSKKVTCGWIDTDSYGSLVIKVDKHDHSGSPIAEVFEEYTGKKIAVHYYITDETVTEDQALEASVRKDLGGDVQAEFILDAYSSWTIMDFKQEAVVGGHDLIAELESYEDKFCTLIIESEES
jgi:hypothetical protein